MNGRQSMPLTRHTIEASEKPLLDIFCDKYLFRIPSYQRPYRRERHVQNDLVQSVRQL